MIKDIVFVIYLRSQITLMYGLLTDGQNIAGKTTGMADTTRSYVVQTSDAPIIGSAIGIGPITA